MTARREPPPRERSAEGEGAPWILRVLDAGVPDAVDLACAQAALGHRIPSGDAFEASFPGPPREPRRLGLDRAARETPAAHAEWVRAPAGREDVEERRRRGAALRGPLRWEI